MAISLKKHLNLLKFSFAFRRHLKSSNEEDLSELLEIALEERGILFKLLQHLFPEKIEAPKIENKALNKIKIIRIIEKELNLNFYEHFTYISEAIFCASIGQVHKAELKQGPNAGLAVAIKIQYPNVKDSINSQIRFLKIAASTAKLGPMSKWNIATSSHITQIEKRLNEEMDYKNELNNLLKAQHFKTSKINNSLVPFESFCSSKILTQSWIEGVDLNFIKNNWNDTKRKLAAELLVESYLKQIFVDRFFQGDTNFSNFIFQENDEFNSSICIHWIDFGNWCPLSLEVQQSLFSLIHQTIDLKIMDLG